MSEKQKLLIIGGNGYVGSTLSRSLSTDFQIFSTFHRGYTPVPGVIHLPAPAFSEKDQCDRLIEAIKPDFVVYCIGSNDEGEAEKSAKETSILHSSSVTHLMHYTDLAKAKFIYISNDLVFSGIEGNFSETDTTIPSTQLGKAKVSAENLIKTRSLNHLIIRCAPLIGRGTLDHPSWLDRIREQMTRDQKVRLTSREIHNPVHISFLVTVLKKALHQDLRNKILHVAGLTKISNVELIRHFVNKIGMNEAKVEAPESMAVTKPSDYSLNFSETLKSVEAQPLLLEQSFDLIQ